MIKFILDFELEDVELTDAEYSERIAAVLHDVAHSVGDSLDASGAVRDDVGNKIGQWEIV